MNLKEEKTENAGYPVIPEEIPASQLEEFYLQLLRPRQIEEKMLNLLRQGKISKWFSGIGQEAISVGAALAMEKDEIIFTMHRNLGVFTAREVPLSRLFSQWQGKAGGFTKGRDRSFHFGSMGYHIVGMISHLGPQLSLADGVGLAHKLKREEKCTLVFTGEGATSQGEFHEALNVAAVWQLPVLFVIENNGYGLSTPVNEQYRCGQLIDKAKGYGMRGYRIDGNDIATVFYTIRTLAKEIRVNPEPVLLECMTFRIRGHEEASGTKYVPRHLMDEWQLKDPLLRLETLLIDRQIYTPEALEALKLKGKKQIEQELAPVLEEEEVKASIHRELADVYHPYNPKALDPAPDDAVPTRYIDAIAQALDQSMALYPNLILMGQDIAEYGGVFKITEGLVLKYGKDRVRNTPLCESAIIGTALGLSLKGFKSMVEMQFADFVSCGFNQIVNNLAKLNYRWGESADIVIRMPAGGGMSAGPFHSQSNEAWFFHTPGLKIVYPSNPYDAKGLLMAALDDPNPVLYFEHKGLYRSLTEPVPNSPYRIPLGQAKLCRDGIRAGIITYGMGVSVALEAARINDWDVAVLDLRSLMPLDLEAIRQLVIKTHRILILHEDTLTGGIGAEISAYIGQDLFQYLDAPVFRLAALDTPVPFAGNLEKQFMPWDRLTHEMETLLAY
ncbi:MAG: dehydrogenase E1 component subunit alpha/beta [Saprospiraceae bacterium]|nr:dehydrogenase E1 component subunit alpha/beta [Saprospiraceae bacterium]